jgi:uncharacterized protein (DUF934 family)
MRVIKNGAAVDDAWRIVADEEPVAAGDDVIVPFARWQRERDALSHRDGKLGVSIVGDQDLDEVAKDIEHFELIALEFPKFTDGRNYSNARLLRERYGYRGELRAIGDVLRDQIFFMARCGIDSFALAPGRDPEEALKSLKDFSVVYQAAEDAAVPAWRLRGSSRERT